ncbi:hypothetical protein DRQ25_09800 [Candidatus Fermentibacteria bacterium]|nr:MAG: hypothetical protein DRQ25_09800 [Candidatus Fermentibacteria bacterium]
MLNNIPLIFCLLVLSISCSENHPTDMIDSAPYDTLQIVDSIGIMYGDSNYVFGRISDVERGPHGEVYVLDGIRNCILVFSKTGEFIQQTGRYGEGPGEFNSPSEFVITGDGSICVVNNFQWSRFNTGWEYLDSELLEHGSIKQMESYGPHGIVGIVNRLGMTGAGMSIDRRIAIWSEFSPNQEDAVFYQAEYCANDPDEIFEIDRYHSVNFTVIDSTVFVVPDPLREPVLYLYDADATPLDTIVLPYTAVEKSTSDIAVEKEFIEGSLYSATSGERSIEWEPYQYRPMIGDIGSDSLGRLWVQRAFEDVAVFDIIDPGNFEIVETAIIPGIENIMNWKFHISEYGIIGVPVFEFDYPILYMIE